MTYISGDRNPFMAYSELCQRVMLIRNWTEEQADAPGSHELRIKAGKFNPRELMYAGRWQQHLQMRSRKKMLSRFDFKMLPQALMEMAGYPSEEIFNYWYRWFMDRDAEQTWLLIQAVCNRYFCGRNQYHQRSYWVRR